MVSAQTILESLKRVIDPDLRKDIVSLGFVKNVHIDGGRVSFTIELTTPACPVKDLLKQQAMGAVAELPGVESVDITMTASVRSVTAPRARAAAAPGSQKCHRGRGRQRRRRQDHGVGQPGAGADQGWQPSGHPRRRYLRPERAVDAGPQDATGLQREADRSRRKVRSSDRLHRLS